MISLIVDVIMGVAWLRTNGVNANGATSSIKNNNSNNNDNSNHNSNDSNNNSSSNNHSSNSFTDGIGTRWGQR